MSEKKLVRNVGLLSLTLYGVGDILGSGVYGLVGKAAGEMGYAVWLAFLTSMVAAGLTGLSYASLGSRYPRAGGASYTTYRAFKNGYLAYIVGLAVLASGLTSMATAAKVFSGYLVGLTIEMPIPIVAIFFSLVVAYIVFRGINESLFANGICTIIEVSGLLLVLAVGFRYLGTVDYLNAVTPSNPSGEIGVSLMLTGAVLTFYSFVGFEDILNIAEEVKDPIKTVPRGLILAISIASVIYLGVSLIAVSVLPPQVLAASKQPLVDVVSVAAPWFPVSLFGLVALFAVSNTALLNFVMGSRLLYGMSKQGLVPSYLGQVHGKRHTPHLAVITIWVLFVVLILVGDISSLAKATSVLLLSCFSVVNIALVVLQRKEKIPGAFEVPAFVPILGTTVCLAILSKAKFIELTMAGSILIGISILYVILRPKPAAIEHME